MGILVLTPEMGKIWSLAQERVDPGGYRCSAVDNVDSSIL